MYKPKQRAWLDDYGLWNIWCPICLISSRPYLSFPDREIKEHYELHTQKTRVSPDRWSTSNEWEITCPKCGYRSIHSTFGLAIDIAQQHHSTGACTNSQRGIRRRTYDGQN